MYLTFGIRNSAANSALSSVETSAKSKTSVLYIPQYLILNVKMFRKCGYMVVNSERNISGVMNRYGRDINNSEKCLVQNNGIPSYSFICLLELFLCILKIFKKNGLLCRIRRRSI